MDNGRGICVKPWSQRRRVRLLTVLLLLGGLALVLLVAPAAASAGARQIITDPAATPSWVGTISGSGAGSDGADDVVMLKGDVTLVAGTLRNAAGNDDISLTKYHGTTKLWTRTWDGPAHGADRVSKVVVSLDGSWVYVAGQSLNSAGNLDIVVLRRSVKTGGLKWVRTYDGSAHMNEMSTAIGVDRAGSIVVAGITQKATDADWVVVSWGASGARRWVWRYDAAHGNDTLHDAVVSANGTVYATGLGDVSGKGAAITARLSKNGQVTWLKKYYGPDALGAATVAVAPQPGGGVYVCGMAVMTATGADGMVLSYSGRGTRRAFALDPGTGGATNDVFLDIAVTSTKSLVTAGYTQTAGVNNARFALYRPDGTVIGAVTVPGMWSDTFTAVATDAFGGWYVVGTRHVAPAHVKISVRRGSMLNGGAVWQSEYGPVASISNGASAIAVRDTSVCVVGAHESGGVSGVDQVLLMYSY